MPGLNAKLTVRCPGCRQEHSLDDLVSELERQKTATRFVDELQKNRPPVFERRCHQCRASFSVSSKQVASIIIHKQTQELFASISNVLMGRAKLE